MTLEHIDRVSRHVLLLLVVALPFFLIHVRPAAEIVIAALAIFAIARILIHREWRELRRVWLVLALAYWAWIVASTIVMATGLRELGLALAWVRFPLAALAAAVWIITSPTTRAMVLWSLALACLWITLEVWLQLLVGRGVSGPSADIDGILTGPFTWARAGPFLVIALWPALLVAHAWLTQHGRFGLPASLMLIFLALATLVVIGQRMPVLQAIAVIALAAAILPSLRIPALVGILAGCGILALTPILAPEAFRRLLVEMPAQIAAFPGGPYGEVWGFWIDATMPQLWTGLGHLGWDNAVCPNGSTGCHPHSHYLQAFVEGGLPGFALFLGMSLALMTHAIRVTVKDPSPWRIGTCLALVAAGLAIPALKAMTFITQIGLIVMLVGLVLSRNQPVASEATDDTQREPHTTTWKTVGQPR